MSPRALFFDVFGTVVDWRSTIVQACASVLTDRDAGSCAETLADAWRDAYLPAVDRIRFGARPWVDLDQVHREILEATLQRFGIELSPDETSRLNDAWHRLDPWPDSVAAIERLRAHYIVAAVSNASFRMVVNLSRHGGLTWDIVLGAELARSYKLDPTVYLSAAHALRLAPEECMMVSAHNIDLDAARAAGLQTAFVCRPREFGAGQSTDLEPDPRCSISASSLADLVGQLALVRGGTLGTAPARPLHP